MSTPNQQPLLSRTCQNCARAKIRCQKTGDHPPCDRCHRLSKECIYPQARRRNNGTRKDHRIEALEAKINRLLEAPHARLEAGQPPSARASQSDSMSPATAPMAQPQQRLPPPAASLNIPFASSEGSSARSRNVSSPGWDVIDEGLLSLPAANVLLDIYKTFLTPHFPFVVVAPHVNAESIRKDKPFLFLAILGAACHQDMPMQRKLGDAIKKTISTRMILDGEVSMDLLQGLLVHLAWCHYHTRPRRYAQLLQLAVSIVLELRIDRPRHAQSRKLRDLGMGVRVAAAENVIEKSKWGRDERRAVAGCHYLSSTIAILLQRYSTFPHSPWIEEVCLSLRDDAEYPTDKYILYSSRIQHIMEKMDRLISRPNGEPSRPNSAVELFATMLRSELEAFLQTLPFPMEESKLLVIQFHTAHVFLYQLGLSEQAAISQPASSVPVSPWCLDFICAGLIAAKSLLTFYLSVPKDAELAFNNTEWVQIGFILTIMAKLYSASTGPSLAQSTSKLRRSLGMTSVINQCVTRVGTLLSPHFDSQGQESVFHDFDLRIKRLKAWFDGQFAREPDLLPERDPDTPGGTGQATPDYMVPINQHGQIWTRDQQMHNPAMHPTQTLDPAFATDLNGFQWPPDATFDEMMGDWMLSYPVGPP